MHSLYQLYIMDHWITLVSPNDRLVVATTSASCNRYIDHSLGIRNVHTFVFGQHAFWRQTSSLRKVIDRSRVLSTKKSPCRPTAYTKHTHHRRSSISVSLSELLISYAVIISLNFLHWRNTPPLQVGVLWRRTPANPTSQNIPSAHTFKRNL